MDGKYQVAEDFVHRKIGEIDVLISVGERIANFNGYMTLNSTASFLWDAMVQPKSLQELTQALTAEFDVTEEQARTDVKAWLTHLLEQSMIREVSCDVL